MKRYYVYILARKNKVLWKTNLIESRNKEWKDLYSEISDPIKIIYE